jgi:tetratricopeptide (TPR) repeat protein
VSPPDRLVPPYLPAVLPDDLLSLRGWFALKLYLQLDTDAKAVCGAVDAGREQQVTESQAAAPAPGASGGLAQAALSWPLRIGTPPPLADRLSLRPESAPDLSSGFVRNAAIALVPRGEDKNPGDGWLQCCGKTQVAAAFAAAQWRARAVDLLLWIDASSLASVLSGYVEAATAIGGSRPDGDAATVAASMVAWLGQTDQRWLVVFDDLADGDLLTGLWPSGPSGRVLLTTGSVAVADQLGRAAVAQLGPFSAREAMSYLVGRLSADPDQRRGAMDLIEALECDPLALAQATAAISSSWLTCADYRDRFLSRSELIRQHSHGPLRPARVTWTLSLDSADYLRPGGAAQTCLVFAALLDGRGTPFAAFTTRAGNAYVSGGAAEGEIASQRTANALRVLEQVGLVTIDRDSAPPSVWMNTVMQRAVLAATPADMFEPAVRAAASALLELWTDPQAGRYPARVLRASAEALRQAAGRLLWSDGCHPLIIRTGQSLDADGLAGLALSFWSEVASISDNTLGPDHRDSQALVGRLAQAYVAAGRRAEAVTWYRQLVAGWDAMLGAGSPRTLTARVRLGGVLVSAGLVDDAVNLLKETRTECERSLGPDHWLTREAREELAAAYSSAGQVAAAIRIYRRTLAERERDAGPQDAGTIATRQKLADAYFADGKTKDALAQYKRAAADCERSLGADHPATLRARASLALVSHQAGRMAVAIQIYQDVHAGSARSLGPDHRDTLAAGVRLAAAYYAVGRITDAAIIYRQVIERGERALPATDPLLESARDGLAAIAPS